MHIWHATRSALRALVCLVILGCDDDPAGVTTSGDFDLTVDPAELTIAPGTSSSAVVTIDRTSFSGGVTLGLLNPPSGVTGAFAPTPATTDEASMAVSVGANTAPGNYPLTIQGTASGSGAKTTTLTLHVPGPPAAGTIEYLFCSASAAPVFVAYQDGFGPWRAVTASPSGGARKFALSLSQPAGGVLFVYQSTEAAVAGAARIGGARHVSGRTRIRQGPSTRFRVASRGVGTIAQQAAGDAYYTEVLFASSTELAQDAVGTCAITQPTRTVTGTVTGVPVGAYGIVSLGGITNIFDPYISNTTVAFSDVPAGLVDLVGTRAWPGVAPERAIVMRNLNVQDGGLLPAAIDFNGSSSSVPVTATATVAGGAGDRLEIFTDIVTANGIGGFWSELSPSTAATRLWAGLAPSVMTSGDFHSLVVFASPQGSEDFRVAVKYVGPVSNQTLTLGPTLAQPSTTQIAAGGYPRFRFQSVLPGAYDKGGAVDVLGADGAGNSLFIVATSAYLLTAGSASTFDIAMPDVAGLSGFPTASRLTVGPNDVSVSGFGFTGPGVFDVRPVVGSEFRGATRRSSISVP